MLPMLLLTQNQIKMEPVSALTDISISSDDQKSFKEVNEGDKLTHTITVRDEDVMQQQFLIKGVWVASPAKSYPGDHLNILMSIKSGTSSFIPMSIGPGVLVRRYTVTVSAGKDYWKNNPNASYRDVIDEFAPMDEATGNEKDTIAKNNRVQILVRIKRPSK